MKNYEMIGKNDMYLLVLADLPANLRGDHGFSDGPVSGKHQI